MVRVKKTALITGVTGQDGFYLAEFLIGKGYRVIGLSRNRSASELNNIKHLLKDIELVRGDLLDINSLLEAVKRTQPDELYNLASQSSPWESWVAPIHTGEVTGLGAHHVFEAVRQVKPDCRVFQASSAEMFGRAKEVPQNESTPFNPVNPYAVAKGYAHQMAGVYRKGLGLFIACGIMFNHESPRRPLHFAMQKIAYGAACIKLGLKESPALNEQGEPIVKDGKLVVGNLDVVRDWGFAGDYVEAMWKMLQHTDADDFVIGTGVGKMVRDLCEEAFSCVGLDWREYVVTEPRFVRAVESGPLVADAAKARRVLGWQPKTSFEDLVRMLVEAHLVRLRAV